MKETDPDNRKLIRRAIREGGLEDLTPVLNAIVNSNAISYTQEKASEHIHLAKTALNDIADTSFKETLIALADLAIARKS